MDDKRRLRIVLECSSRGIDEETINKLKCYIEFALMDCQVTSIEPIGDKIVFEADELLDSWLEEHYDQDHDLDSLDDWNLDIMGGRL